MTMQTQSKVLSLMNVAKTLRLDQHAAPLSVVRRGERLTIEDRVLRTEGFLCWVEAFTPERPGASAASNHADVPTSVERLAAERRADLDGGRSQRVMAEVSNLD
jgi:hypothetical protein